MIDDADTVSAKFLYLRIPEQIRDRSQILQTIWQSTKALNGMDYGTAISILVRASQNQNKGTQVDVLRDLLVWHLQTKTVPQFLRKCYSTVELTQVKTLLGASNASGATLEKLLTDCAIFESTKPD